jgi:hypothetical protein
MKINTLFFQAIIFCLSLGTLNAQVEDPLPSWKNGNAKQAIIEFVKANKDLPDEDKIAVFDQDGTLWVEHPIYSQLVYCLERVPFIIKEHPELENQEPL